MFHPTGLGVDLLVFFLIMGDYLPGVIENHTAGAGSPLIDGKDIVHDIFSAFIEGMSLRIDKLFKAKYLSGQPEITIPSHRPQRKITSPRLVLKRAILANQQLHR
jgi:hypothetical protein